jgi:hypothetical protein
VIPGTFRGLASAIILLPLILAAPEASLLVSPSSGSVRMRLAVQRYLVRGQRAQFITRSVLEAVNTQLAPCLDIDINVERSLAVLWQPEPVPMTKGLACLPSPLCSGE